MARLFLSCLVLMALALAAPAVHAQTDTPTPTETPTLTPTPDYRALNPVGTVILWSGNYTPAGWLVADGSCISRDDYSLLFSVVGELYGVCDGVTTFALPDLRGRVPVGAGAGDGLSPRAPGDTFGAETHTLTIAEMPQHSHGIRRSAASGTGPRPAEGTGNATSNMQTEYSGGNQPHNIMQPSLVLNYIINAGTEPLDIGSGGEDEMPTPLPEIVVYATVVAGETEQAVAFSYSVTAGDFMVSMLLLLMIGLSLFGVFFQFKQGRRP